MGKEAEKPRGAAPQYAAEEAGRPGFRSRVPSPHLPASLLWVATLRRGPSRLFPHRILPSPTGKRRRAQLRFKIIQCTIETAVAEVSKPIRHCEGRAPITGALAPSRHKEQTVWGGLGGGKGAESSGSSAGGWTENRRRGGEHEEGWGAQGGVGALLGLLSPNLNQEEHQANSGSKRISS